MTPGPVRVTSDSNALTPFMPTYYNHACRPQPTVLIFSPPVLPPNIQSTPSANHSSAVTQLSSTPSSSVVNSHPCDLIEGNDKKTEFYTGLPSWEVFLKVYKLLIAHAPLQKWQRSHLTLKDELVIVLMRLRLNLMLEDLAYRFNVSKSTISRIFQTWLDVMYARLKFLIVWLERDAVRAKCLRYSKISTQSAGALSIVLRYLWKGHLP